MVFMLICTEGVVSEPEFIKALVSAVSGQSPADASRDIDILPLPLGGNQGHVKLVETANQVIAKHSESGLVSLACDDDIVEKWIVVDHDEMEKNKVDPDQLRKAAETAGYTLIISKPNFEFFVLAFLSDLETALATKKKQFAAEINSYLKSLNEEYSRKGFSKDMYVPSKYSKNKYVAEKIFGMILSRHPELIRKMVSLNVDVAAEQYSEMPRVVQRIIELHGGLQD